MSAPSWQRALRTLAVLIGAPLAAAVVGVSVARFLPCSPSLRLALGQHLLVPCWVGFSCWLTLQPCGRRAWAACLVLVLLCGIGVCARALLGAG
jgi:hypothetical protein